MEKRKAQVDTAWGDWWGYRPMGPDGRKQVSLREATQAQRLESQAESSTLVTEGRANYFGLLTRETRSRFSQTFK